MTGHKLKASVLRRNCHVLCVVCVYLLPLIVGCSVAITILHVSSAMLPYVTNPSMVWHTQILMPAAQTLWVAVGIQFVWWLVLWWMQQRFSSFAALFEQETPS